MNSNSASIFSHYIVHILNFYWTKAFLIVTEIGNFNLIYGWSTHENFSSRNLRKFLKSKTSHLKNCHQKHSYRYNKFLKYSLWVIFLPFRDAFLREFCPKLKDIFVPMGLDHDFNFIEEPNFINKCDFTRSENVTKLKINETLPTGLNFTGDQNHDFLRIDLFIQTLP